MYASVSMCFQRQEDSIESPGAGIIVGFKTPNTDVGKQTQQQMISTTELLSSPLCFNY